MTATGKKIRHFIEYVALLTFFAICRILPLDMASNLGAWIGGMVGPLLPVSKRAHDNLKRALPDHPEPRKIILDMWKNLGRVVAEYPHLDTIAKERTEFIGDAIFAQVTKQKNASLFIGAHMANWEVYATAFHRHFGRMGGTYRAPNNPLVNDLINKSRSLKGEIPLFPKSREGGRNMMQALKSGLPMGILIDQKYNEGVAVDFFGRPAMTNPVFAQLAQKYHYDLIPCQIIRTKGAHFVMKAYEPIITENKPIEDIIREAHIYLEDWIKQHPEQWLWLHSRWGTQDKGSAH